MARKIEYEIGVDSSKGVSGVKDFSRAVRQELKNVESDFDETATAGDRVATVLSQLASQLDTELGQAAQAADKLRAALGEDLAGRADVGQIIGDLQRMGLSMDEITADADKLGASLKELDEVQMRGLDNGLGGVNTKVGELNKSVGGSRSVFANMVGNATQDLGALTGVAGSAGVAIGQMGEYMVDAAADGEKLSSVIGNFSKIGVPLLAVGVATQAISSHFEGMRKANEKNAEQARDFADAMQDGATAAEAVEQSLINAGKVEFTVKSGEVFDVTDRLARLGLTVEQFSALVAGGVPEINRWGDAMMAAGADSDDVKDVILAASIQAENLADASRLAAINTKVFGSEQKKAATETTKTTKAIQGQGTSFTFWGDALELAAGKLDDARTAAQDYADTLRSVDWKELEGTAAVKGAVSAWDQISSARFGLAEIAENSEEAWAGLGDAITRENGKIKTSWDLTTEAGRKMNDAMQALSESMTARVASSFDAADGSWRKFRKSMQEMHDDTVKRLMDDFGLTREEAEKMTTTLIGTSKDWKATFTLSGAEEAQLKLDLLSTSIDNLPDNVETKVTQKIIAGDYQGALKIIQDYYDDNPATLPVVPVISAIPQWQQRPPGVPIPTSMTTRMVGATAVTPAMAPVPIPVSIPVPGGARTVVINQNINGILGDEFAVARTIEDATRRTLRLMPVSP